MLTKDKVTQCVKCQRKRLLKWQSCTSCWPTSCLSRKTANKLTFEKLVPCVVFILLMCSVNSTCQSLTVLLRLQVYVVNLSAAFYSLQYWWTHLCVTLQSKFWRTKCRIWLFIDILMLENCQCRSLKVLEKSLNLILWVCYQGVYNSWKSWKSPGIWKPSWISPGI